MQFTHALKTFNIIVPTAFSLARLLLEMLNLNCRTAMDVGLFLQHKLSKNLSPFIIYSLFGLTAKLNLLPIKSLLT